MSSYHIGIDIGGTKTAVALFDTNMCQAAKMNFPTSSAPDCRSLTDKIFDTVGALKTRLNDTDAQILSVGVASPGPLDPDRGVIIDVHTLGYKNQPIIDYIRRYTSAPCALIKDTNAAVYYEGTLGCGRDFDIVLYVTVSTGIGSGLFIDKKVITGSHNCAGELGHTVVVPDGRRCGCGLRGCLEAYASGTAIAKIATEEFGRDMSTKEVFELAREKDSTALSIVSNAGYLLGYALGGVCRLVDPGAVIFGGSVTKDFDVLEPYIRSSMEKFTQNTDTRKTQILLSDTEGRQTLYGAALYGKNNGK